MFKKDPNTKMKWKNLKQLKNLKEDKVIDKIII